MQSLSRTTFLLGSGISIPSRYPSTGEITNNLLSKDWLHDREQRGFGIPLESPMQAGEYFDKVHATLRLLRLLRNHADQHLALYGDAEATYEDIYYLGQQLLDNLRGEYDNPGLLPWLLDLRAKLATLESESNSLSVFFKEATDWNKTENLKKLVQRSLEHIQESVALQLPLPKRKRGLNLLNEFRSAINPAPLNVVTLNHDTLLESFFSKQRVMDGFSAFSSGVDVFNPQCFDDTHRISVRFLKLHGSVNWFRYDDRKGQNLALRINQGDTHHIKDSAGRDLGPPVNRLLLAGTTNKELAYGSGIFLELMFQFHRLLKETQLLIVSGYGFGDKGINNRIWAWLDSRSENRIMVLHANVDDLRRRAKPSFPFNLDRHKSTKKFVIVDKWLSDCAYQDIEREFRKSSGAGG